MVRAGGAGPVGSERLSPMPPRRGHLRGQEPAWDRLHPPSSAGRPSPRRNRFTASSIKWVKGVFPPSTPAPAPPEGPPLPREPPSKPAAACEKPEVGNTTQPAKLPANCALGCPPQDDSSEPTVASLAASAPQGAPAGAHASAAALSLGSVNVTAPSTLPTQAEAAEEGPPLPALPRPSLLQPTPPLVPSPPIQLLGSPAEESECYLCNEETVAGAMERHSEDLVHGLSLVGPWGSEGVVAVGSAEEGPPPPHSSPGDEVAPSAPAQPPPMLPSTVPTVPTARPSSPQPPRAQQGAPFAEPASATAVPTTSAAAMSALLDAVTAPTAVSSFLAGNTAAFVVQTGGQSQPPSRPSTAGARERSVSAGRSHSGIRVCGTSAIARQTDDKAKDAQARNGTGSLVAEPSDDCQQANRYKEGERVFVDCMGELGTGRFPKDAVVVSVVDDTRHLRRDFIFRWATLLTHMHYFVPYLDAGRSAAELDISVNCDMRVFEWLVEYIRDPSRAQSLDVGTVVAVLISADFLRMDPLVDQCLKFMRKAVDRVVRLPLDMGCLPHNLVRRLAGLFTAEELEGVHDRRDRLLSRLYSHKVEELYANAEGAGSHGTLVACTLCGGIFEEGEFESSQCLKADAFVDFHGGIRARHKVDPAWNMKAYANHCHAKLRMTWRQIYWRLWELLHGSGCTACLGRSPDAEPEHCANHPDGPVVYSQPKENNASFSSCFQDGKERDFPSCWSATKRTGPHGSRYCFEPPPEHMSSSSSSAVDARIFTYVLTPDTEEASSECLLPQGGARAAAPPPATCNKGVRSGRRVRRTGGKKGGQQARPEGEKPGGAVARSVVSEAADCTRGGNPGGHRSEHAGMPGHDSTAPDRPRLDMYSRSSGALWATPAAEGEATFFEMRRPKGFTKKQLNQYRMDLLREDDRRRMDVLCDHIQKAHCPRKPQQKRRCGSASSSKADQSACATRPAARRPQSAGASLGHRTHPRAASSGSGSTVGKVPSIGFEDGRAPMSTRHRDQAHRAAEGHAACSSTPSSRRTSTASDAASSVPAAAFSQAAIPEVARSAPPSVEFSGPGEPLVPCAPASGPPTGRRRPVSAVQAGLAP